MKATFKPFKGRGPDIIHSLRVGLNAKGLAVCKFESRTHKYFDLDFHTVYDCIGPDGRTYNTPVPHILLSTDEPDRNEAVMLGEIAIWPETEAEREILDAKGVALPLKWEYSIVFVPWEDFDIIE